MTYPPDPAIRDCMRCRRKFVSMDPSRVRRCYHCKNDEADEYVPRTGRVRGEAGTPEPPGLSDADWGYR